MSLVLNLGRDKKGRFASIQKGVYPVKEGDIVRVETGVPGSFATICRVSCATWMLICIDKGAANRWTDRMFWSLEEIQTYLEETVK